jgi:hypothetical protein
MTTATTTEWIKFAGQHLTAGDEVLMSRLSRKLGGKTGVVDKQLQKNVRVIIDGQSWRVSPSLIESWRRGSIANLPAAKKSLVDCNPAGLYDCKPGDAVLMYGGSFTVVEIITISPLICKGLGGRTNGREYKYNPDMFVQKLDPERFSS